ncbi:ATP11 protein-domain-containing protein [Roridomyces roridus]|uniref:ATP11 protein-domain-containing protein n=1 Tax=Roridomyces roridus TaxID=1738132 RepID=A0AAD7FPC4_9AGAR|nr:ATP11 protein-domain-containing protein [Roridomyces roridus]
MHRLARSLPRITRVVAFPRVLRCLHTQYDDKYSAKLLKVAEERGLSLSELKEQIKREQEQRVRPTRLPQKAEPGPLDSVRKDSSPVKPLSSILNLSRIISTPHTEEQISALWTVYHASRSNGTGRGYLCASIPLELYTRMTTTAAKYPLFVVPLRRERDPSDVPGEGEADSAHEFYFLQWSFHEAPPVPSAVDDLFFPPPPASEVNPQTTTVMFTPLQEYKMRGSFATPYLVLTFYTDLARSHGLVLLRGEITPAAAAGSEGVDGRYLLRQDDAHRLSMGVQNFFLWDGKDNLDREQLVKAFHETPDQFEWEELLKHAI